MYVRAVAQYFLSLSTCTVCKIVKHLTHSLCVYNTWCTLLSPLAEGKGKQTDRAFSTFSTTNSMSFVHVCGVCVFEVCIV